MTESPDVPAKKVVFIYTHLYWNEEEPDALVAVLDWAAELMSRSVDGLRFEFFDEKVAEIQKRIFLGEIVPTYERFKADDWRAFRLNLLVELGCVVDPKALGST